MTPTTFAANSGRLQGKGLVRKFLFIVNYAMERFVQHICAKGAGKAIICMTWLNTHRCSVKG